MTNEEKMLSGKLYDPSDDQLSSLRQKAHKICREYNAFDETDPKREEILTRLFGRALPHGLFLQGPIQFDYGKNTTFGQNFYANFNLVILDCAPVSIGDNVFLGPNVSIVTPAHPLRYEDRNPYGNEKGIQTDQEYAKPITIGSNCWIASNVTITGGVSIGEGCVIGAGSVVTRDIPPHSLAAGVPCKVIRTISEEDAIALHKELF